MQEAINNATDLQLLEALYGLTLAQKLTGKAWTVQAAMEHINNTLEKRTTVHNDGTKRYFAYPDDWR